MVKLLMVASLLTFGDLLPRNSLVVRLGPFEESGHEAEAI